MFSYCFELIKQIFSSLQMLNAKWITSRKWIAANAQIFYFRQLNSKIYNSFNLYTLLSTKWSYINAINYVSDRSHLRDITTLLLYLNVFWKDILNSNTLYINKSSHPFLMSSFIRAVIHRLILGADVPIIAEFLLIQVSVTLPVVEVILFTNAAFLIFSGEFDLAGLFSIFLFVGTRGYLLWEQSLFGEFNLAGDWNHSIYE